MTAENILHPFSYKPFDDSDLYYKFNDDFVINTHKFYNKIIIDVYGNAYLNVGPLYSHNIDLNSIENPGDDIVKFATILNGNKQPFLKVFIIETDVV